ncbi:hypothetical protein ACVB8X_42140 [Streptomyces sp. NRAIS4]
MGCRAGEKCPGRTPCREPGRCHDAGRECSGGGACPDDGQRCAPTHGGPCTDGNGCGGPDERQAHDTGGCDPATVQHGVEAGAGGTFTDSVPALAAGSALIATACGGAGYRLWGRRGAAGGRPTDV